MSGSMWQRTLIYLGLREEPEEAYDELPERGTQEFNGTDNGFAREDTARASVRPLRIADDEGQVRRVPGNARVAVVEVSIFDDVEAVGARYRTGQPVLFDVSRADASTARRVLDFVSGVTYALRGRLTKVGSRAFLLVPDGVDLDAEERDRLTARGYRLPDPSGA